MSVFKKLGGFFSGVFTKPYNVQARTTKQKPVFGENDPLFFQRWLAKKHSAYTTGGLNNDEIIFIPFLLSAIAIARPRDLEVFPQLNDASIFEVSCFQIYMTQVYAGRKFPTLVKPLTRSVSSTLVHLAAKALNDKTDRLEKILLSRLKVYQETEQGGSVPIEALGQFVVQTAGRSTSNARVEADISEGLNLNFDLMPVPLMVMEWFTEDASAWLDTIDSFEKINLETQGNKS